MKRSGGSPDRFDDPDRVADAIIARVGKNIVLALPLGLGKANHVANALFARAAADPSIRLRIFTALTLEKPRSAAGPRTALRAAVRPIASSPAIPSSPMRTALHARTLPPNIKVDEFFFQAGTRLGIAVAQQSYISANYTHALRYVLDRGVNVVAQLVAKRVRGGETRFSLSCNPDLTLDLLARRARGQCAFCSSGRSIPSCRSCPATATLRQGEFDLLLERRGHRLSPVRAAARAHRSRRVRRGHPCRAHHRRRRHPAARHRIARRRGGACADPAASRQRRVSRHRGAARSSRQRAGGTARKRAVRHRPARRERDVRRGLPRSHARRHPQARGRRHVAAGGVLPGLARVLPRAARHAGEPSSPSCA